MGPKNGTLTAGSCLSCFWSAVSYLVFEVAICFVLAVAALFLPKPDDVELLSKLSLTREDLCYALVACLIFG